MCRFSPKKIQKKKHKLLENIHTSLFQLKNYNGHSFLWEGQKKMKEKLKQKPFTLSRTEEISVRKGRERTFNGKDG